MTIETALERIADALERLVDVRRTDATDPSPSPQPKPAQEPPEGAPSPEPAQEPPEGAPSPEPVQEARPLSVETLRPRFQVASRAGHRARLQQFLSERDTERLPELAEEHWPAADALLRELGA